MANIINYPDDVDQTYDTQYVDIIYEYSNLIESTDCAVTQSLAIINQMYCHVKLIELGLRNTNTNSTLQPSNYDEFLSLKNEIMNQLMEFNDIEDIKDEPGIAISQTKLVANYPNPFNPSTTIYFELANESSVQINIFNIRGQLIKTLVNDIYPAGTFKTEWNGTDTNNRNVASGIYFYQMKTESYTSTRRMIILK